MEKIMGKRNLTIQELRNLIFERHNYVSNLSELEVVDTENDTEVSNANDTDDDYSDNENKISNNNIADALYQKLTPQEKDTADRAYSQLLISRRLSTQRRTRSSDSLMDSENVVSA